MSAFLNLKIQGLTLTLQSELPFMRRSASDTEDQPHSYADPLSREGLRARLSSAYHLLPRISLLRVLTASTGWLLRRFLIDFM